MSAVCEELSSFILASLGISRLSSFQAVPGTSAQWEESFSKHLWFAIFCYRVFLAERGKDTLRGQSLNLRENIVCSTHKDAVCSMSLFYG